MCLFIYTLSQNCKHVTFQNVSECPTAARDIPDTRENRGDMTLSTTRFLFDTARSKTNTPEFYTDNFPCKKRKAVRPVAEFCAKCQKEQRDAAAAAATAAAAAAKASLSPPNAIGNENDESGIALFSSSVSGSEGDVSGM